jgi:hypothetical protein
MEVTNENPLVESKKGLSKDGSVGGLRKSHAGSVGKQSFDGKRS